VQTIAVTAVTAVTGKQLLYILQLPTTGQRRP